MKSYPSTFATDNQTPWLHRHLYKDYMPSSIQACFTACTLYSNMTSSNKTSVFRVLCQNIGEFKECNALTPVDRLARLQALLLYQVICLFDGDVTLRSLADRNMLLLQIWADDLCKIRENLGPKEYNNSDESMPKSWEVCPSEITETKWALLTIWQRAGCSPSQSAELFLGFIPFWGCGL